MLALLHSVIDKGEHEKVSLVATIWKYGKFTRNSVHPPGLISHSEKAKGRFCFVFRVV